MVEEVIRQDMLPTVHEMISPLNKGIGTLDGSIERREIASLGWNLLREDLNLPAAVLYQQKLEHNLNWMQRFIAAYGMKLAPHGKTTMTPALFEMQLRSGAWGITLATAQQTLVAHAHGVRRVLMANQLVGKENMAVVARLLRDRDFDYFCLVDSTEQVEQLGHFFKDQGERLNVLVELGVEGGRAGIRSEEQFEVLLQSLDRWRGTIALCGVEVYEGVLSDEPSIRSFLGRAVDVTRRLVAEKRFERSPAILTGAGSAWYDVVADAFSTAGFGDSVEIVLRPGCYLTHDVGAYREAQNLILERNPIARAMKSGLIPALQVWAYVQSIPEAGKAIIGMGKRDAAFDSGLPVPALHFRPGQQSPQISPRHWRVTKMMDQHAFLEIAGGDDVRVGDMIAFDIAHPCLTFDKWRTLAVVNAAYDVVDVVPTFF
ncbi:MAG TPA: amino acid deaminase [Terracidiphilus sp.]|nr:amino acid deaminase [Terracidiphilus sp.]